MSPGCRYRRGMGMTPNTVLQAWRKAHRWSQDEMAEELRAKGASGITKRTIQRWENGEITNPQGKYARALQALTGLPIEMLGFPAGVDAMVVDDGRGGHDLEVRPPARYRPAADRRAGTCPGSGCPATATSPAAAGRPWKASTTRSCCSTATGSPSAASPVPPTRR
jgi:transcriptional regulator with XRE-family HTH domain